MISQNSESKNRLLRPFGPRNDGVGPSQRVRFDFIDRGFDRTLLLVPGWAADYRIFSTLDLKFNYLMPEGSLLSGFKQAVLEAIRDNHLKQISILGSSMGGYLAAEFAIDNPGIVKDLTLIGMRRRYDRSEIDKVKSYVETNKAGFLYKFYQESFSSSEKELFSSFKRGPMKDYIKEMSSKELVAGLDYLASVEIDAKLPKMVKTRFIHGSDDKIAPVEEIIMFKKELQNAGLFVMQGAGHIPFLREDFGEVFDGQ